MGKKAEATKERIIEIAIEEFAAHGLEGVRVDVVAEKAAVNKERIYAYFGSKDGLYTQVLKHIYGLIIDEERTLLSLTEKDIPALVERILALYFDFHSRNPQFSRILARENLSGGRHAKDFGSLRKESFGHLSELYRKGQARGVFKSSVSFESFIFTLTAISFFYFSNRATMSQTLGLDLQTRKVTDRMQEECTALIAAVTA